MRARGFYVKAGLCQYSHFIWRQILVLGESHSCKAGIKAKSSVSWTKAYPQVTLPANLCGHKLFLLLFFAWNSSRFKPHFLCQNTSQPAIHILIASFFVSISVHTHGLKSGLLKAMCPLSQLGQGFHPLPQSLSNWATRLSVYSSSGCLSQPGYAHVHTRDAGDHSNLSWGKEQKYRTTDHRPLQMPSGTNTHPSYLLVKFHSAPMQL